MNERRGAAMTYVFVGAIALYRAVKNAVAFEEGISFGPPFSPFLQRWGDTIGGLVAAAALFALAVVTLKARDRAEGLRALHFVNETVVPLAPLMAGFVLLIVSMMFVAVPRYIGDRGLAEKPVLLMPVLVASFYFGAWILLHYRRLAVVDDAAGVLEISYGRPWALWTRRLPFKRFDRVEVVEVQHARGRVFRIEARGAGGSALVTFTFARESADETAGQVRHATGWK